MAGRPETDSDSLQPRNPCGLSSTSDSIQISWSPPDGYDDEIDKYDVRYKVKGQKKWLGLQMTENNTPNLTLFGLSPNTEYEFRVRALTNDGEEGPFSESISTKTVPEEKTSWGNDNPGRPEAIECTPNTLTIRWDKPQTPETIVSHYEVKYKQLGTRRWKTVFTKDHSLSFTIDGLEAETEYQFKVRAVDKDGEESLFSEQSETISTAKIPSPKKQKKTQPGPPHATGTTSNSISISWDKPKLEEREIDRYEVRYRIVDTRKWDGRMLTENSDTRANIGKLKPETSYECKVRSLSADDDEGPFSEASKAITTAPLLPKTQASLTAEQLSKSKPGIPIIVDCTHNSISIFWEKPQCNPSLIEYFEVRFRKSKTEKWKGIQITEDAVPRLVVQNLDPCTCYQFKVRAVGKTDDTSIFSEESADMMTENLPAELDVKKKSDSGNTAPGQPMKMECTPDTISLFWEKPRASVASVYCYEVKYKKADARAWSQNCYTDDDNPKIKVAGLEPNTAYVFRVRCVDEEDECGLFSKVSKAMVTSKQSEIRGNTKPRMNQDLQPGEPIARDCTIDAITISWPSPKASQDNIDNYEVVYKQTESKKWTGSSMTEDETPNITITGLKHNSSYQFAVTAVMVNGEKGPQSKISESIWTKMPVQDKVTASKDVNFDEKTGKPELVEATSNTLTIRWKPPNLKSIDYYEVRYRLAGENRWKDSFSTNNADPGAIITGLTCKTSYCFRVRPIMQDGVEGHFSEVSDVFATNEWKLGPPMEEDATATSLKINWTVPNTMQKDILNYEVKYRKMDEKQWTNFKTKGATPGIVISELGCNTKYHFRVKAIMKDGEEGPFSDVSQPIATKMSLAQKVKPRSTPTNRGPPVVFKVNLRQDTRADNPSVKTRKYILGERDQHSLEKTIMVVGARGAGKSTLIDGMINYILDVAWEDDFRFTLVDLTEEEKLKVNNQCEPQTEWITCYTVNKLPGSHINFNLTIIDTPGFGDTREIRDKQVFEQIRILFTTPPPNGIDSLDAVCFVIPAPLARLTQTEKYIFDQILALFGKENIFVLSTFADGNEPSVKAAIKEAGIPVKKTFVFNNSALFADPAARDGALFSEMFWKMGKRSFSAFFDELYSLKTRSLQLTGDVFETRKKLETTIQELRLQIKARFDQLETIRQKTRILETIKDDIKKKKHFTYEVEEQHQRKIQLKPGEHVTNCVSCNLTCHYPCSILDDDKSSCSAMTNGKCTVCPQKCVWSVHKSSQYRFETYTVKLKKTYEEMKKQYNISKDEEKKQLLVLSKLQSAYELSEGKVRDLVKEARRLTNKLQDSRIAHNPNPLSEKEYIGVLIQAERQEGKSGFQARIKALEELRKQAKLIDDDYDPFRI